MNLNELYNTKASEREDAPVLEFLSQFKNKQTNYLEAGSGVGRFPKLLRESKDNKNLAIKCIEINENLVSQLRTEGFEVLCGDIKKLPFENESFDIVHCSHVIEHFGYPDIAKVLDELFRVAKKNGYIIIRSPLMHPNFYNDLDHIRPYPPKSILQHFANPQQQKVGGYKIKLIRNFTRRHAKEIDLAFPGSWKINRFLKIMWIYLGWPNNRPDGYVAIFQKI